MAEASEVLLFTIDAGGGHRAAAKAIAAAAEQTGAAFRLRIESFQQLLLPLDILHTLSGLSLEDGYNLILRRRWNALMVPLLRLMHGAIRLRRPALVRALVEWLRQQPRPAAVVSVIPHFNGILRDAIREAHPGVPLLVVLTDFADFPPRFWIEPGIDRVVVGTDEARAQALALGVAGEQVVRVSGMVLHPRFYRSAGPEARDQARGELDLPADAFVTLLLFGGKGSPEMRPLAEALLAGDETQRVIAVCGHNQRLETALRALAAGSGGRLIVFGFTDRVADWLAASDLLLTKPGPGSLSEAFQRRVPVVVTRNLHTIPQERFNTEFVERHGLGVVVHDWRDMARAVLRLRRDRAALDVLRAGVRAQPENRAVYEVVEAIARETSAPRR
jgi:UDP-N-acetylglucosamine:LPS N-acetylglucosamine transferase